MKNTRCYEVEITGLKSKKHKQHGRYTLIRSKVTSGPSAGKVFKVGKLGLPPEAFRLGGEYVMSAHALNDDPENILEDQFDLSMISLAVLFWFGRTADAPTGPIPPAGPTIPPTGTPEGEIPEGETPEPEEDPDITPGPQDPEPVPDPPENPEGPISPEDAIKNACGGMFKKGGAKYIECIENLGGDLEEEDGMEETDDSGTQHGGSGHTGGTAPLLPVW